MSSRYSDFRDASLRGQQEEVVRVSLSLTRQDICRRTKSVPVIKLAHFSAQVDTRLWEIVRFCLQKNIEEKGIEMIIILYQKLKW